MYMCKIAVLRLSHLARLAIQKADYLNTQVTTHFLQLNEQNLWPNVFRGLDSRTGLAGIN